MNLPIINYESLLEKYSIIIPELFNVFINEKNNFINDKKLKYNIQEKEIKIFNFNRNLNWINKYKNNWKNNLNENKIKQINKKYNDFDFYSILLNNCCRSIRNELVEINEKINLEKDKIYKIEKFNRYLKNQKENSYLNEFFELNKYKWSKNLIEQLSKNLNLSKFCIYR